MSGVNFFIRTQTFTIFVSQMRVAVFFLCLCILLLKGYDYTHTVAHTNSIHNTPVQHFAVLKDTGTEKDEEYLISDDKEDEDPNSVFGRKYRLLATYNIIPAYLFISHHLYSRSKGPLAYYGALSSCKYITQKVLRI